MVKTFEIEEVGGPNEWETLDILAVSQSEFVVVVPRFPSAWDFYISYHLFSPAIG